MNPSLFRKLVEKKLLAVGTEVGVEYAVYEDCQKVKTVKGMYSISRLSSHPLMFGPIIEVTNDNEQATIDMGSIKLISGSTPIKFAALHGIRPDGKTDDAPKRRGRKPKNRNPELDVDENYFSEEEGAEEDEEVDEVGEKEPEVLNNDYDISDEEDEAYWKQP